MNETEYAYAVAYTRTLENKMLGRADFEALLNATSYDDAVRYLSDKGYGHGSIGQNPDAEALLKGELSYIWHEVRGACPEGAPIDILLYQNDFHNLKAILKAVFSNITFEHLLMEPYTIHPEVIHSAITNGKPEDLPNILKDSASEAYSILARDGDGQRAEIILDTALFLAMNEVAQQSKNGFLVGWVDLSIAIMDMKIAIRGVYSGKNKAYLRSSMLECDRVDVDCLADAATHDIPAVLQVFIQSGFPEAAEAAQKSISSFEKWCDNELIHYLRSAKYKTFGFEPIINFLVSKQYELQAVRVILSGLRGAIPTELLRERIRDLYV